MVLLIHHAAERTVLPALGRVPWTDGRVIGLGGRTTGDGHRKGGQHQRQEEMNNGNFHFTKKQDEPG